MVATRAKKFEAVAPPAKIAEEVACRESGCEKLATTDHYCRAHYIKNWTKIREKRELIKDGKLQRYIDEIFRAFPEGVLQAIRSDLSSEEEFSKVCNDLNLHEGLGDILAIDSDSIEQANVLPFIRLESENEDEP